MRIRTVPTAAFVALALLVAGAPAADEPKGDLAQLQGSWTAKVGPDKDIPLTVTIKGNAVDLVGTTPNGDEFKLKGELKVDDKASPKTVDWLKFSGPNGDEIPENRGIYKLEGDSWTVCSGGPGNDRPSEFKVGQGGPPMLTTWTRVKAAEKAAEGDLAKFQGSWTGKDDGTDVAIKLEIRGNAVIARWTGGDGAEVESRGEFRINDQARPRTVDFFDFKDPSGERMKDILGLYEISGETIKICTGAPGEERPTEMKGGQGGPPSLRVFTRKKD